MSFTKGPWRVVEHNWSDTGIFAGQERIATLSIDDEYEDSEEGQERAEGAMVQQAHNARLIAAAPDLYEACRAVLLTLNINRSRVECKPLEDKLRAALAKSEGR